MENLRDDAGLLTQRGLQEIKERLLERVIQAARQVSAESDGRLPRDVTARAVAVCMDDPSWLGDYGAFLGGDIFARRHPRKDLINPEMGRRVKAALGLNNEGAPGKVDIPVENSVIQSCTALVSD